MAISDFEGNTEAFFLFFRRGVNVTRDEKKARQSRLPDTCRAGLISATMAEAASSKRQERKITDTQKYQVRCQGENISAHTASIGKCTS
jgi:hypothetical protein